MTGKELAAYCKAQVGQCYVWGGLGYALTESRLSQLKGLYPAVYTAAYLTKCRKNLGKRAFDCVGLVKHFLWGNSGDGVLRYYGTNGLADVTANGMLALCTEKGAISTLPELPGLFVWQEGHCGVYLGNGKVVEARGIDYGVVETDVTARGWKQWGKLPLVAYGTATATGTHIEEYPLAEYRFGIHRARLTESAAFGKVLAWAEKTYKTDKTLEGAINASFWSTDPKKGVLPVGTVIMDGEFLNNDGNGWGFGVDWNGETHIDRIWKNGAGVDVKWKDMLSGTPQLIHNGERLDYDNKDGFTVKNPRSAVAIRGGSVLFITVDGRQTGKPGMTMKELQDYLLGIGCTDAIALDGGGSSIQIRDEAGTGVFSVKNSPTEHRAVYNLIAAYRKPKEEPEPVEPEDPPAPESPGKSITWDELAQRLRGKGIDKIIL